MDESWRMEYHTYLWSREFYLRKLMDQDLLTFVQFNRIDKLMRQHYHADEAEERLRKEKLEKELALSPAAEPEPAPEHISEDIPEHITNVSLTDLARPHETNPSYVIQRWLRSHKHS